MTWDWWPNPYYTLPQWYCVICTPTPKPQPQYRRWVFSELAILYRLLTDPSRTQPCYARRSGHIPSTIILRRPAEQPSTYG
jgi:hypothetical protein